MCIVHDHDLGPRTVKSFSILTKEDCENELLQEISILAVQQREGLDVSHGQKPFRGVP